MTGPSSYRILKTEKNYLKLILANVVNRFGDSIDAIAFSWMMYEITKSASMMALILGLNYIPTVLLTPFAGALVDRLPKKTVIVLTDICRALLVLLTAVLLQGGRLSTGLLILVTMLNSTVEAFCTPAASAIVPKLISPELYTVGMALNGTLTRAAELVGLALAGGVVALAGVGGALLADMATFLISAMIISRIKVKEKLEKSLISVKSVLAGFTEGVRYALKNPVMITLGLVGLLINFCIVPLNVFATPYVVDAIKGGPEILSLVQTMLVLGMALGAFITPKMKKISGKKLIVLSGVLLSATLALLALLPSLAVWALRFAALFTDVFLMGLCIGVLNVIFSASFMRLVPPEQMGIQNGLLTAVLCLAMPVGSFLCSAVASFVPITTTLLIAGCLSFVLYMILIKIKSLNQI